ncbi:uncharacterized protein VTP21DRAFT_8601 [Calcarisporiella thermophila]|uniref:uncharacterized protein n=1 Tax=Calcarisporiella thermophila TaxID=911321 RepID=UPI00374478CB
MRVISYLSLLLLAASVSSAAKSSNATMNAAIQGSVNLGNATTTQKPAGGETSVKTGSKNSTETTAVNATGTESAVAQVITKCTVPGTFAITFDDGPFQFTEGLVDYLNQNKLKATFFVNGKNYDRIETYAKVVKKMFDSGHQIGSHTWSHKDLATLKESSIRCQMKKLDCHLKKIIGVRPIYMRPPFGSVNKLCLRVLGEMGYKVVTWDVDSKDYEVNNLEKEQANYQKDLNGADPKTTGHISLQHDVYNITAGQLAPWAFDFVQKQGYKAVTVAECLNDSDPKNWYRA